MQMQLNFPIKWVLRKELNRKSTKSSSQSIISISLCYIFTAKFNFGGFIHRKSTEFCAVWYLCVYQNFRCIGEMKIKNLAWPTGWQSISLSFHAAAWLEDSCWERIASITSWVGTVLQSKTLFWLDLGCPSYLPCSTSMQLFNVNQKHSQIILLLWFDNRTEWP